MSSSEEYLAKLGIDTSDGEKAIDQMVTAMGHLSAQFADAAPRIDKAERALLGVGAAAKQSNKPVEEGTDAWKSYTKELREAQAAYREFKQGQVTGEGGGSDLPSTSRGRELIEISEAANAQIITDLRKREAEAKRILDAREATEKRVADRSAQSWIDAETRKAKALQDAANLKSSEVSGRGYANTSVLVDAEIDAQKRASAAFARGAQERWAALAQEDDAVNKSTQNLARYRYALYDVSNAVGVVGLAFGGVAASIFGFSASFERQFADVRRTVGVTGESARDLYQEFLKLTTQIPSSFSDLTEIGALAGQLGIAEDRVASFTKTTSQFSATTDVSVEKSATAFGRLDQLIDGVNGQYAALGSSILNVGINSVATESDIISIASQIAATGNQSKLSADEIIGLSSSLASLGIAPEAARGTILRVFSEINRAVSEGGSALQDFASVSGMSADQFAGSWGKPGGFTSTFLAFLKGVDGNSKGAESAIRSLGITAVRDVNALLKLSQNYESVGKDLDLAAKGFANSGVLAENFGIIAETTSAKLQVLGQTFQVFLATLGESSLGPMGHFVDLAGDMLKVLIAINQTPIGQTVGFMTAAFTGLVAIMAILAAVGLRGAASFLALRTAMGEVNLQAMAASGGLKAFTANLLGATGATAAFGAAVKATGVGALVAGGFWLLAEAVSALSNAMLPARDRAEAYFGTLDGLSDAIKADNVEIFNKRTQETQAAISGASSEATSWVDGLQKAAEAQTQLSGAATGLTGDIDVQTLSIGANTQEWFKNQLMSNENFKSIFANIAQLKALTADSITLQGGDTLTGFEAFDMQAFTDALVSGGADAGTQYIESFKAGVRAAAEATGDSGVIEDTAIFLVGNDALTKAEEVGRELSGAIDAGMQEAAAGELVANALGNAFGDLGETATQLGDEFKTLMDDTYGMVNAQAELTNSLGRLGEDFANNGSDVASSGSAMQATIKAIFDATGGGDAAAAQMQGLFNSLIQGGFASAQQLGGLAGIISSLTKGKGIAGAAFDMSAFAGGIDKVNSAASRSGGSGGAAASIRTLVDYANDLSRVFSRSFDIQFGASDSADKISSTWNKIQQSITQANIDIQESIEQTNRKIQEYQATMSGLASDKAISEYWLRIAETYGDALRAGELRADIADIDAKLASSAAALAKTQADGAKTVAAAQDKTNKTLDGNSDVAIANRAEINGLISSYQDYIVKLAASGASQETLAAETARLKQEFINQAVQMGYTEDSVRRAATAFDNMTTAINNVPRNITVSANTNPALQALAELEAKAASVSSQSYGGPTFDGSSIAKAARAAAIMAEINGLQAENARVTGPSAPRIIDANKARINVLSNLLNSGSYRVGGWTGDGNPNELAGAVHKREFVLNETGAQMLPMGVLNAMNQGRAPMLPASSVSAGRSASAPVELSARDRQLLGEIRDAMGVTLSGPGLTATVNLGDQNSNRRGGM